MSFEPVITLKGVSKKYSKRQVLHNSLREQLVNVFGNSKRGDELHEGEFWALNDVSFRVYRGECVALSGHNGSGKSTILKLIARVTYPTTGEVSVQTSVAPLIELGAGFHMDLSGVENVYMNGAILGLTIPEIRKNLDRIIDFSGLGDFISVPVKKYSSGMYLRLAFSIAVHSPALTFLFDEVLSVGDAEFQERCVDKILELKRLGKTIFIVSHDDVENTRFVDRKIELRTGKIVQDKKW